MKPIGQPIVLPNGQQAPFSPAIAGERIVFLSGQLAFDENGKIAGQGDTKVQTVRCLENLAKVLSDCELAPNNIAKITAWLTDDADFGEFNAGFEAFFGEHRPARSTVRAGLLLPGALVEIEAIALLG